MTNKDFGKILGVIAILLAMMFYVVKYEMIIPVIGASLYIIIGAFFGIIAIVLCLSAYEEDCY